MKISIYSTQIIPSNPDLKEYGGLELIAGLLAKHCVEQGHEVHLFATNGSYSSSGGSLGYCTLHAVGDAKKVDPIAAWKQYWDTPETREVLKSSDMVCSMDWDYMPYSVAGELKHLCHVHHGPDPGFGQKPTVEHPNLIGVSFYHAKMLSRMTPGTEWRAVENSIDCNIYPFNPTPIKDREPRLLWLSRIFVPKGAHRAIDIANEMQIPIDIVGGSFGDFPPYTEDMKKRCSESKYAKFYGEVSFDKKIEFYRNAKCIILPIEEFYGAPIPWSEPFGLITPEANACGTPVVVTPNGGFLESMIHGYNGFFANSNKDFIYHIKQVDQLKPEDCRKMAMDHFHYPIMGERYLKLFNEIIEGRSW